MKSDDLEPTLPVIESTGVKISKVIFSFPAGRLFHFIEPSGNKFVAEMVLVHQEGKHLCDHVVVF